jgi:hypothetical protein
MPYVNVFQQNVLQVTYGEGFNLRSFRLRCLSRSRQLGDKELNVIAIFSSLEDLHFDLRPMQFTGHRLKQQR